MCDSIVAVVACGFYHLFVMLPPLKCSDSWKICIFTNHFNILQNKTRIYICERI